MLNALTTLCFVTFANVLTLAMVAAHYSETIRLGLERLGRGGVLAVAFSILLVAYVYFAERKRHDGMMKEYDATEDEGQRCRLIAWSYIAGSLALGLIVAFVTQSPRVGPR
jgi:hypothetical protein